MIFYILIDGAAELTTATIGAATSQIFERGNTAFLLLFLLIAPMSISYILTRHCAESLFPTIYDFFGQQCKQKFSLFVERAFSNKTVKDHAMEMFAYEL